MGTHTKAATFVCVTQLRRAIMQNDSTVQTEQAEIPAYLQCKPRTFNVSLKDDHGESCELVFKIIVKCIDEELHEHNKFWSGHQERLNDNDGDIVKVVLKLIGPMVHTACHEGKDWVSVGNRYGINSIFNQEGWNPECFEITHLYFEDYINDNSFEVSSVALEG